MESVSILRKLMLHQLTVPKIVSHYKMVSVFDVLKDFLALIKFNVVHVSSSVYNVTHSHTVLDV